MTITLVSIVPLRLLTTASPCGYIVHPLQLNCLINDHKPLWDTRYLHFDFCLNSLSVLRKLNHRDKWVLAFQESIISHGDPEFEFCFVLSYCALSFVPNRQALKAGALWSIYSEAPSVMKSLFNSAHMSSHGGVSLADSLKKERKKGKKNQLLPSRPCVNQSL